MRSNIISGNNLVLVSISSTDNTDYIKVIGKIDYFIGEGDFLVELDDGDVVNSENFVRILLTSLLTFHTFQMNKYFGRRKLKKQNKMELK